MSDISKNSIETALNSVIDPESGRGLIDAGMVSSLRVIENRVVFSIEVDPARGAELETLRQNAEKVVLTVDGVDSVTAVLTAERKASVSKNPHRDVTDKIENLAPGIRHIIAVASGKGGVGKSTVSANLAVALADMGYKTGLLDADIYGPSVPKIMGLSGQRPDSTDDNRPIPLEAYGVELMSIGFMVDESAPMIWRGPMVQSALQQMLRDVEWGALDILVVDMPPGTGDAQLTMAQKVPMAGAVIVSTPQDLALIDARKGLAMFEKVGVRVFGLVENMSHYICPSCGHESHIFGKGSVEEEAVKIGCDFIGAIPLNADIRVKSDDGMPIVKSMPDSDGAQAFKMIAHHVVSSLGIEQEKDKEKEYG